MSEHFEYEYECEKYFCPLIKEKCNISCAWFKDGECCIQSLPELVEKLDCINTELELIDSNLNNIN